MPECEKCGKKSGRLTLVEIAGARLYVCGDCERFGKPVLEERPPQTAARPQMSSPRPSQPRPDALSNPEMELADDFSTRIQRARERKGWSREELGKRINERVSIISKLENNEWRPTDDLTRKLEKALEIKLKEAVKDVVPSKSASSQGVTLGDLITMRKDR